MLTSIVYKIKLCEIYTLHDFHARVQQAHNNKNICSWLGRHNIDYSNYKYGSATADERVNDAGFCRVMLPTMPRSGSTWFRQVFEKVTGFRTCSIYQEGIVAGSNDTYHSSRKCWMSVNSCGASASTMQGGYNRSDIPSGCRNTRIPTGNDPTLVKSHLPFQSAWRNEVRWFALPNLNPFTTILTPVYVLCCCFMATDFRAHNWGIFVQ